MILFKRLAFICIALLHVRMVKVNTKLFLLFFPRSISFTKNALYFCTLALDATGSRSDTTLLNPTPLPRYQSLSSKPAPPVVPKRVSHKIESSKTDDDIQRSKTTGVEMRKEPKALRPIDESDKAIKELPAIIGHTQNPLEPLHGPKQKSLRKIHPLHPHSNLSTPTDDLSEPRISLKPSETDDDRYTRNNSITSVRSLQSLPGFSGSLTKWKNIEELDDLSMGSSVVPNSWGLTDQSEPGMLYCSCSVYLRVILQK